MMTPAVKRSGLSWAAPEVLRKEILSSLHNGVAARHLGEEETLG